jgi:hypothetical protein
MPRSVKKKDPTTRINICATPHGPCASIETSDRDVGTVLTGIAIGAFGALALGASGGLILIAGTLGGVVGRALTSRSQPKK